MVMDIRWLGRLFSEGFHGITDMIFFFERAGDVG